MDVDLDEDGDINHAGPSRSRRDEETSLGSEASEEEEEEGEDGDFIDVLDIMDGRGVADDSDDPEPGAKLTHGAEAQTQVDHAQEVSAGEDDEVDDAMDDSSSGQSGEEDEKGGDDDDDAMISGEEDEGVDLLSALDNLDRFVSKLSTSKRKADDEEPEDAPVKGAKTKKKARFVQDVTEAGTAEGEFGARPSGNEYCYFAYI